MRFTESYHDYMRTRRFLRTFEPPRKYGYARLVLVSTAVFAGVFLLAMIADASIERQDTATQEDYYPPSYGEND